MAMSDTVNLWSRNEFDDDDLSDRDFIRHDEDCKAREEQAFDDVDEDQDMDLDLDLDDGDFTATLESRLPWLETPLDKYKQQIRVLTLRRGPKNQNSALKGKLHVVDLSDGPKYETLSYVWGAPPDIHRTLHTILLNDTQVTLTDSLFEFLFHLRSPDTDRCLWVDALCIDQADEREKQHQLQLMNQIYRRGSGSHIWFGRLDGSWQYDIWCDDEDYMPTTKMTVRQWEKAERMAHEELHHYIAAGGRAPSEREYKRVRQGNSWQQTFSEAFEVLDGVASGMETHDFPLYLKTDHGYVSNRHWVDIIDCIRWLATREWWSRVWTYQETILPTTDSTVHTTSLSFLLSKVLDGMYALRELFEKGKRMIKHYQIFWAEYQYFNFDLFSDIHRLREHRRLYNSGRDAGLSLRTIVNATQSRRATNIGDHFYGFLAVLPVSLQEHWAEYVRDDCSGLPSVARAFSYCTINIFFAGEQARLDRLDRVIGLGTSRVDGLPTWAIDLSAPFLTESFETNPWELHNATPGTEYRIPPGIERLPDISKVSDKLLFVESIKVGTVRVCGPAHGAEGEDMLYLVEEWRRLYRQCRPNKIIDEDKFWRTAFMNRNIWLYVGHQRQPLYRRRIADIQAWWQNFKDTRSHLDLNPDQSMGDGSHGTYHFRALSANANYHRFFVTTTGEPGVGPKLMQPGDEVYALKGCHALVMLRRTDEGVLGSEAFKFVGLCFVDSCMNGEVTRGNREWKDLILV